MRGFSLLLALAVFAPALAVAQERAGDAATSDAEPAPAPVADASAPGDARADAQPDTASAAPRRISPPVARLLQTAAEQLDAGRPAAARLSLERALARAGAERDRVGRSEAARRLGALLASTARLHLDASNVPLDAYLLVTIDGELVQPDDWAKTMFVEPGKRVVSVRRPGCGAHEETVTVERGTTADIVVPALTCAAPFATSRALTRKKNDGSVNILFRPRGVDRDAGSRWEKGSSYAAAAIGAGAASVASGIVTLVFAAEASESKETADRLGCSSVQCGRRDGAGAYRSYESNRKVAIFSGVVTGITAGIAVTATVLHFRDKTKDEDPDESSVSVAPVRGGAVVGWTGVF